MIHHPLLALAAAALGHGAAHGLGCLNPSASSGQALTPPAGGRGIITSRKCEWELTIQAQRSTKKGD
jgi:hypothetical protein